MDIIRVSRKFIHQFLLSMAVVLALPAAAQAVIYKMDVQDWLKIRHSDNLTSHPSLHAVLVDWTRALPGSYIEICFTEDKSHAKWAVELRNRLVALGIPSQHLKLQTEDMEDTFFKLRVVTPRAVRQ